MIAFNSHWNQREHKHLLEFDLQLHTSLYPHSPGYYFFESSVGVRFFWREEKFLKSLKELRIIYVVYSAGFPEMEVT